MNPELRERVRQNRQVYESLKPGDTIEMDHEVKVGMTRWHTVTKGEVVKTNRQREGLHFRRNHDDDVFRDEIITKLDDGSITTLTLDEYSVLKKLPSPQTDKTEASKTEPAKDETKPEEESAAEEKTSTAE